MAVPMARPGTWDLSRAWEKGSLSAHLSPAAFARSPSSFHLRKVPMTKMASTPGLSQIVWLIALLIAPAIEELLFRGVLYGGYRKSFGPLAAGTLTTFIFVLLHIT